MIKNENELVERDLKRDIWQEALDAVRSIKAGNVGTVHILDISASPVAEARKKTGLFQAKFAELLGISVSSFDQRLQKRAKAAGLSPIVEMPGKL